MDRLFRATVMALAVFWALALLFFMQPFTGSFLLWVAVIAVLPAVLTFVAMRRGPRRLETPPPSH